LEENYEGCFLICFFLRFPSDTTISSVTKVLKSTLVSTDILPSMSRNASLPSLANNAPAPAAPVAQAQQIIHTTSENAADNRTELAYYVTLFETLIEPGGQGHIYPAALVMRISDLKTGVVCEIDLPTLWATALTPGTITLHIPTSEQDSGFVGELGRLMTLASPATPVSSDYASGVQIQSFAAKVRTAQFAALSTAEKTVWLADVANYDNNADQKRGILRYVP
jgi:hypothetical protein